MAGQQAEETVQQDREQIAERHAHKESEPFIQRYPGNSRLHRACSLDVEIVAYFFARDWSHFLGIQGELLLQIMEIVQTTGAQMALQSRTLYLATSYPSEGISAQNSFQTPAPDKKPKKQKEIQHDSRTDAVTGSPR